MAQVAQSVEQRTENPRVGSSILSLGTNISSTTPTLCRHTVTVNPNLQFEAPFRNFRVAQIMEDDISDLQTFL